MTELLHSETGETSSAMKIDTTLFSKRNTEKHTLWIKNHWINQEIPSSWSCTGKSLFNERIFIHWTRTYLVNWMKIHPLNKDFTMQHHKHGISWLIQWFFIQSADGARYQPLISKTGSDHITCIRYKKWCVSSKINDEFWYQSHLLLRRLYGCWTYKLRILASYEAK